MKQSTQWRHQANKDKSFLEVARVQAWGALHSLQSEKKVSAEKGLQIHFLSNEEKEKWIKDHGDWGTAVARKRLQDAETAIMQEQEDMRNTKNARFTTTKTETTYMDMFNAIGESLRDRASSNDEEDGEDEDDEKDIDLGKLSKADEPGWVMGTIPNTVQHHLESLWQMQMRLDKLTQRGWGDSADSFCERDIKYGMTKLKVPAVVKPKTDMTAATPSPTTFGKLMQTLDIVPGQSQMPQVMSRPGCS